MNRRKFLAKSCAVLTVPFVGLLSSRNSQAVGLVSTPTKAARTSKPKEDWLTDEQFQNSSAFRPVVDSFPAARAHYQARMLEDYQATLKRMGRPPHNFTLGDLDVYWGPE